MQKGNFLKIVIALIFVFRYHTINAQTCVDDFFTMTYKASEAFSISRSIITEKKEIVCSGHISYTRAGLISADGWIAKMSLKGTVLWSKRFKVPGFNYAILHDVVQGTDDSYFAVGEAVDTVGGSGSQYVKGVLLHIDKYGNIIQLKSLEITDLKGEQTFFRDIHKTSEGDFIIGGYNDYHLSKFLIV